MANPVLFVLPHFLFVYAFTTVVVGCQWVSFLFCVCLGIAIFKFRLPALSGTRCDEFFTTEDGKSPIIAHRGAGVDAPENTLAAIKLAKQNGATMIEFDIGYTSDGVPVIIHDDEVDRTTDGSGNVADMTLERIKKLNASAKHPNRAMFPNEKVPTLEETIELCLELGLKMLLDVKGNAKLTAEKICAMYQKFPTLYKNAAVCSFHPEIVYMVKRQDVEIMTGLTHRSHYLACEFVAGENVWRPIPGWKKALAAVGDVLLYWAIYHWLWYLCGSNLFLVCDRDVNDSVRRHFKRFGIQCVVWTVNDPYEKRYMSETLHLPYMTDTLAQ